MDLPNWIYIVGIVILNILLILIICMIVFKNKESDIEIEKEVFKDEMSIASEEAELRIQIKKLKELNDALHKDLERNPDLIIKL